MRSLTGAAVVPAAPLMLPQASPQQPLEVRDQVPTLRKHAQEAIRVLPAADIVVLLAGGPRGVFDRSFASLAPLGIPGAEVELPVVARAIEHFSRLAQYPMFRGDPLGLAHSVLALQLVAARGSVPVLPVNVPAGADFDVLVSIGASIGEAARDADLVCAVLCPGDLSAGLHEASPAHVIPGAADWDAAVVEAFRNGDLSALRELGPAEAQRVRALGWAPLAVLHGVCAAGRLRPQLMAYCAPRGVGELVGRCIKRPEAQVQAERFGLPAGHEHDGVVPRTGDPRG